MVTTREANFWEAIRENLKLDFIERLENSVKPGWADTFYMNNTFPGFIELKAEENFPGRIDFEPAQPIWLTAYWSKGGYCYVFLHVTSTNKIYVWAGKDAMRLSKPGGTKSVPPIIECRMDAVGWKQIYDLFRKRPTHLR